MYTKKFLLGLYKTLHLIRTFESECAKLYHAGLINGYFHPCFGQEAIPAGACAALSAKDYIVSTHRGHGHCIARGASVKRMVAELLGKETGYSLGLGGSMHVSDLRNGNIGENGIVGGGIPLGIGAALGIRIRREDRVVVVFLSDGAANNGVFPESLNCAAVWNLPVIFVIENNHFAVSTPVEGSFRTEDLYKIGQGYAVESCAIDGNDVLEVFERMQEAVATCRKGKGPVLVEAKTYRIGGHHVNDPGSYMPPERVEYYRSKDPVKVGKGHAMAIGNASRADIQKVETLVKAEMKEAVAFGKKSREMSESSFFKLVEGY